MKAESFCGTLGVINGSKRGLNGSKLTISLQIMIKSCKFVHTSYFVWEPRWWHLFLVYFDFDLFWKTLGVKRGQMDQKGDHTGQRLSAWPLITICCMKTSTVVCIFGSLQILTHGGHLNSQKRGQTGKKGAHTGYKYRKAKPATMGVDWTRVTETGLTRTKWLKLHWHGVNLCASPKAHFWST